MPERLLVGGDRKKSDLNDGTKWGATKNFKSAPDAITVSQFNVTCIRTRVMGAKAGAYYKAAKASVAMRAEIDLLDKTAQALSNEAYAYFKQQLEAKGFTVGVHDLEALRSSKVFAKYSKKNDDAAIGSGSVVDFATEDKVDNRFSAHAQGVHGANLGKDPGPNYKGYTDLAMELGGDEGKVTASVVAVLDFVEADVEKLQLSDSASVAMNLKPSLQLVDIPAMGGQPALNFHSGRAVGGKFWGGHSWKNTDSSWVASTVRANEGLLQFTIDQDKYRAAAMELLKPFLDQLVERMVETKQKGK